MQYHLHHISVGQKEVTGPSPLIRMGTTQGESSLESTTPGHRGGMLEEGWLQQSPVVKPLDVSAFHDIIQEAGPSAVADLGLVPKAADWP